MPLSSQFSVPLIRNSLSRVKSNLPSLRNVILSFEDTVRKRVEVIVERVTSEAAIDMITIINTSGTGWVGRGAQAFAEGRVDTGDMRAAVDVDFKVAKSSVKGFVGWGLNGNKAEPYFLEQEEGFVNPWTGGYVPPMNALWTAGNTLKDMAIYELKKEF